MEKHDVIQVLIQPCSANDTFLKSCKQLHISIPHNFPVSIFSRPQGPLRRPLAKIGIYGTSWAFQKVLCHFSSSITTKVLYQNRQGISSLEFQLITEWSDVPIVMLLKEICLALKILDGTWSSGQLERVLAQVLDSHLFKCTCPLGWVQWLATHPSNIPDW